MTAMAGQARLSPPHVAPEYSRRKNEILDTLEALYLEQGFRSLGVGDLAAAARCSRSTLYEMAPTKEELFLVVLERMLVRIDAEGRVAAAELTDPAERIEAFFHANTVVLNRAGEAFDRDVAGHRPALRALEAHAARGIAWIAQLIDGGIRDGHFRSVDSRIAAEILISAAQRVTAAEVLVDTEMPWTDATRAAIELVLYGLVGRSR